MWYCIRQLRSKVRATSLPRQRAQFITTNWGNGCYISPPSARQWTIPLGKEEAPPSLWGILFRTPMPMKGHRVELPKALLVAVVVAVVGVLMVMVTRFPACPLATNVEYHHIDPIIIKPSDTHLLIREFELTCPCQTRPRRISKSPNPISQNLTSPKGRHVRV